MSLKIEQFLRCDNHQKMFEHIKSFFKELNLRRLHLTKENIRAIYRDYKNIECGSNRYEKDQCTCIEKNDWKGWRVATKKEIRNSLGFF